MGNTKAENIIHSMDKFRDPENLSRMRRLMDKLGNPQDNLRFIHIAGTNGKGSVSRFIYEILEASGYRAGIFTSPYIERFNERIEVDHNLISDSDLNRLTDKVMKAAEALGKELAEAGSLEPGETPVTEFDMITAAAFLYFNEVKADPVVLEVGLGGRGDSTNVIRNPLACVITTIGMDHTDRLGNTLGEIAGESEEVTELQRISVQFGENTVVYELNDSPAAASLCEQLPITVEVEDYSTNEKIFYPEQGLDTTDTPTAEGGAGTLAYYSPWGDVVMFYNDYDANPSLFELGQAVSGTELIGEMTGTIVIDLADTGDE